MKAGVGGMGGGYMKNWCERGKNLNGAGAVMRECIRGKQKKERGIK